MYEFSLLEYLKDEEGGTAWILCDPCGHKHSRNVKPGVQTWPAAQAVRPAGGKWKDLVETALCMSVALM
jgi:hypothetical protein